MKNRKQSQNFSYLTIPFSNPPAITLMDIPSGWLEKATEQMISLQWTCPTRSPFTVQSLRSLPPPATTSKLRQVTRVWVSLSPPLWVLETSLRARLVSFSDEVYRQLMTEDCISEIYM